jgi:hypothetical protein
MEGFEPGTPPERPTRRAIETTKIAEQETRLAKGKGVSEVSEVTNIATLDSIGHDEPSGVGSLAGHKERVAAIRELYLKGDAEGALALGQELDPLASDPGLEEGLPLVGTHPRAAPEVDPPAEPQARAAPEQLVALSSIVPKVLVAPAAIAKLPMDPRAAFILGHVDGVQSMEEILDICAMPESEALEVLEKLRALGVITLG